MWTAESVRDLGINELIAALETATGTRFSVDLMAQLAIVHGASRAGSSVRVIKLDEGESYNESLDYEAIAKLLDEKLVPFSGGDVRRTEVSAIVPVRVFPDGAHLRAPSEKGEMRIYVVDPRTPETRYADDTLAPLLQQVRDLLEANLGG